MINQNHLSVLSLGKKWHARGEGITIGDNSVGHFFL